MQNNSKIMMQLLAEVPISMCSEILDQKFWKRLVKELIFYYGCILQGCKFIKKELLH